MNSDNVCIIKYYNLHTTSKYYGEIWNIRLYSTFKHLLNFSLAPGKSPLCKHIIPQATHTPVGSRPHFIDTSIANGNLSSPINLSLSLLYIKENCYVVFWSSVW